jgi:hypothetical protein
MKLGRLLVVLVVGACARANPRGDCPAGYAADAERTARLVALLRAHPETEPLLGRSPRAVCYAPGAEPGITTDGTVLLDAASDDRSSAARLAHLLVHLGQHLVSVPDGSAHELPARAVEDRARRALGLGPLPRRD